MVCAGGTIVNEEILSTKKSVRIHQMSEKSAPTDTPSSQRQAESQRPPAGWRAYRQEIQFLVVFMLILGSGFTLLSLNSVNNNVIEPFTAGVAKASGFCLQLIDPSVTMRGTEIHNPKFAVNIKNGCNGVEAMIIFLAAVLAFPATWKARAIGLVGGIIAIQIVNLIRVVALFLTGVHFRSFFDQSHTVVWQTVVILCGVLLWIFWANRFALPPAAPATAAE